MTNFPSVLLLVSLATLLLMPSAVTTRAADLPAINFPGHANIGADLAAYKPVASTLQIATVRADRYDRLYFPGDPITLRVTLRNTSDQPMLVSGKWRTVTLRDVASDDRGGIRYLSLIHI